MKRFCNLVKRHTLASCLVLLGLLVVSVILGIGLGPVSIRFSDVYRVMFHRLSGIFTGQTAPLESIRESTQNIVWFLRAPRVLLGALIGAALTLSGVGMQAFTKNPLAEPYVLGISSGASLGAVLAMLLGVSVPVLGKLSVSMGAFAGALVSILLVYLLAKSRGSVTPIRLILVGVAVSAMFQAFTNYIVYTAPDDAAVREATFWMLGGLGSAEWEDLPLLLCLVPPAFLLMLALSKSLNAMMMGDSSAITLGVNLNVVRNLLIVITALLTASSVAVSGCIGFVGLVIPHMVRLVLGPDHRRLLPASLLAGAVFLLLADLVGRTLLSPIELPIGVMTSLVGAVAFLVIFYRSRKRGSA